MPSFQSEYKISSHLGTRLICPNHLQQEIARLIDHYLSTDPMEPDTAFNRYHRQLVSSVSPPPLQNPSLEPEAPSPAPPLTEGFIEYFAACVVDIAQRAQRAESHRKRHQILSQTSPALPLSQQGNNFENYLFQDQGEDTEGPDDEENRERGAGRGSGPQSPASASSLKPSRPNKWRTLEEYCSRSLIDPQLSLVEKVWLIISRTDGECGQLLGQAVVERYDGIRAWVLSYLLWGSLSKPDAGAHSASSSREWQQSNNSSLLHLPLDSTLPASRSDFSRAISELTFLISQHDLESQSCPSSTASPPPSSPSSSSSPQTPSLDLDEQSLNPQLLEHVFFVTLAMETFQRKRNELSASVTEATHRVSPLSKQDQLIGSPLSLAAIGKLVSVHCGHNGWPNREELSQFTEYISEIEFVQAKP
jgi:hypothetical protein